MDYGLSYLLDRRLLDCGTDYAWYDLYLYDQSNLVKVKFDTLSFRSNRLPGRRLKLVCDFSRDVIFLFNSGLIS